ncbi:hypothetical protein SAMN05421812_1102 [Asanoa hainanensis]|uniref:SecDF P1 head subdomain domain-containing protein n=1 Tax=Asanoa hainanensis TaxID=560556 RepID=A0A239NP06_9ACTN|nr:hypothetical protein [Asanoa hainanensis]SNT56627.1 hypothetical protein SAMN05421812_1102 [Asanoa hainanensis]
MTIRRFGVIAIVLATSVAVGSTACAARQEPPTPRPSDPTAPRQLRTPVSLHVVARVDEAACIAGAGGLPGPGAGGDWCYFVDPGFDVTRAEAVEFGADSIGIHAVEITLAPADRAAFAAWTARSAGHQIAVNVQDRVVSAPELAEPLSGEWLTIPVDTEAAAQELSRRLWE